MPTNRKTTSRRPLKPSKSPPPASTSEKGQAPTTPKSGFSVKAKSFKSRANQTVGIESATTAKTAGLALNSPNLPAVARHQTSPHNPAKKASTKNTPSQPRRSTSALAQAPATPESDPSPMAPSSPPSQKAKDGSKSNSTADTGGFRAITSSKASKSPTSIRAVAAALCDNSRQNKSRQSKRAANPKLLSTSPRASDSTSRGTHRQIITPIAPP